MASRYSARPPGAAGGPGRRATPHPQCRCRARSAGKPVALVRDNGPVLIRNATETDVPVLQDIERAAGHWFANVGMTEIAEDDPPSADELAGYLRAGHAWVAVDAADVPVAYLIADRVDEDLHVEQVSVHP